MSITVTERVKSRRVSGYPNPSATLKFIVMGTDDQEAAQQALYDAVWSSCPTADVPTGIPLLGCDIDEFLVDEEHPDGGLWDGTARYGYAQQTDPHTTQYDFDTGGGTMHVTQSLATVGVYAAAGQQAVNYGGAVGVAGDASKGLSVQGVDVQAPAFAWSETHYLPLAYVNSSYEDALFELTGTVNAACFRSAKGKLFQPGEVLFKGASGSERAGQDAAMTFRFAASPNRRNVKIGSITGISKRGWEYLWVRYTPAQDPGTGKLLPQPAVVYVEQVYEYGDFYRLGINV